jgi:L-threonylcarbamoyladenylate synthase
MLTMNSYLSLCTTDTIISAAKALRAGALVGIPTETVYGLAADATNAEAVARIYSVKGRPVDHPLIVHIPSLDLLGDWAAEIPNYAIALARDFWPGPMTLILRRSALAMDFVTGGQDTVGVRVPAHPLALALLTAFNSLGGKGLAAPSANRFGQVSPTSAEAVEEEIGAYLEPGRDLILDGGISMVGVESTIIDCTGDIPRILRPGAITAEMIEASTGLAVDWTPVDELIRVSGSLDSHYSPKAKVVLDAIAEPGEGFIAFASITTPRGAIRLAAPATVEQYARDLYAALRAADAKDLSTVAVLQPEGEGLAAAIRDRLKRAAN